MTPSIRNAIEDVGLVRVVVIYPGQIKIPRRRTGGVDRSFAYVAGISVSPVVVGPRNGPLSIATIAALSAGRVPRHLFALPDMDGGARPAVALVWSEADSSSSGVVAYDATSGNLIAEYALPDADRRIIDAAVLGSGNDTQFVVLGVDGAGQAAVDLIDADTGGVDETWEFFEPDYEALRLVVTGNLAAVLAVSPTGELELEVRALASGVLRHSAVVAGPDWLSIDLARAGEDAVLIVKELGGGLSLNVLSLTGTEPDRAFSIGDAGDAAVARALVNDTEATLLVVDGSGDTSLRRFALDDGGELQATPVLATDSGPRALFAFEGGQLGVLGSDAGGDVFAEQRDADSGELLATLTAEASSPPPPPPPPPPPTDAGGGGGGAADGVFIAFLCAAFIFGCRRWRSCPFPRIRCRRDDFISLRGVEIFSRGKYRLLSSDQGAHETKK
ncbi:MAG: hypothetical protein WD795_19225 [Woeseia sp.]